MTECKVLDKIKLAPNSPGYHDWSNPPPATTYTYRLSNVINSQDIMTSKSSIRAPLMEIIQTSSFSYTYVVVI
ncbi:unnamed protein product [Didymodactylos carnosus]|uniref:Uncharacterized protein n=1 Tax=Didymodactylos carnosus TaxID=1234261 RepID=A0A814PE91_9BILA|nr:unnamed protein product [Didymodactylos carnosus]CAF1130874.1 unnamed protein product [Didymodactylos carnosus]CAF3871328.1 unnamed protein product [Didymodactylos carnosus]CAF3913725.1 unnamed protein product [Didymodactylos carnosus]